VADEAIVLEVGDRQVRLSNPDKVLFPESGWRKRDVVDYYLAVADAAVVHLRERPCVLKRFPNGVSEPFFFQKRTPKTYEWLETAIVTFPSGRHAEEVVIQDAAHLVFACNLGVIDFNPWACRRADLDHPDELRVDLDPQPGAVWETVRRVALIARDVLGDHGLTGFPKTSGSRGMHINARVLPEHGFLEVRRAALALAREVERRAEGLATTRWWKEERPDGTVFVDFNQNARDRTVASAYSIRPTPDARVSCPLRWDEVPDVVAEELRIDTVPERVRTLGDPAADIDAHAGSLASLLELAARDEAEGLGDAPWPPNFKKQPGEAPRVQPSRRRKEP
jgi:bifunctional non-homologous end joining protein LigD